MAVARNGRGETDGFNAMRRTGVVAERRLSDRPRRVARPTTQPGCLSAAGAGAVCRRRLGEARVGRLAPRVAGVDGVGGNAEAAGVDAVNAPTARIAANSRPTPPETGAGDQRGVPVPAALPGARHVDRSSHSTAHASWSHATHTTTAIALITVSAGMSPWRSISPTWPQSGIADGNGQPGEHDQQHRQPDQQAARRTPAASRASPSAITLTSASFVTLHATVARPPRRTGHGAGKPGAGNA